MAASSLALKRVLSSSLFSTSARTVRLVAQPASSRFFNTNALRDRDYDSDDREFEVDRPVFSPISDVLTFDPFSSMRRVRQIRNMMDQFNDTPVASGLRHNCVAKETADGLHLRVDMPGLGKEDVKVLVAQNTLIIKGQGKDELEDDETESRYSGRIDLPEKLYKTDAIKAEMKNGVLKVFVPSIKGEERTDVLHVNVE